MRVILIIAMLLPLAAFSQGDVASSPFASLKGKIVSKSDNTAVDSAVVKVWNSAAPLDSAVSGSNGEYTLDRLVPGRYTVKAYRKGYAVQEIKDVIVQADKTTYVDLKLIPQVLSAGANTTTKKKKIVRLKPVQDK